jgi:septal ring factor EnvC (AmiA/AmiB activator)
LDPTTLGAVLACVAGLIGSVVVYVGKRGENVTSRFNSEIDQVQEERDGLLRRLADRDTQIAALQQQRHDYLVRITQLEIENIRLGGNPTP